jgi:hypothetical protein
MDSAYLAAIHNITARSIALTYDIVCQWTRNVDKRIPLFPTYNAQSRMPIPTFNAGAHMSKCVEYGIPKFHLPGHGDKCSSRWSLNYRRWWGRTDGEGIERNWAVLNRFATATREMAAGARHDFLDYQMGAASFRKICGFGEFFISTYHIISN